MPANKNALIRYKTIDNCLRNHYRRWTLEDLVEACSEALYDAEGITKGVSLRTVQSDIQVMRSDKLGYNAPIEVYKHKYYRYADRDYSITNMPMSHNDIEMMQEAVDMLRQLEDFEVFAELPDIIGRLQDKLAISRNKRKPIINFDSVPNLKGLKYLNPLYNHILHKQTLRIMYQSFSANEPKEYIVFPHMLKEFRNRWFIFCTTAKDMVLYNLALDRIVGVEPFEMPFKENPNFNPQTFFNDVIGVSKNIRSKPQLVKFWASPEQSKYIKTKPIHTSQVLVKENEDESCEFTIKVIVNYELYSILMSYGAGIRIIYPRVAAHYVRDQLKKALQQYENKK